jgi:hypothetical protein
MSNNAGSEIASLPPIIDVIVFGRAASVPAVPARGLIDTGSSVVFIDKKLAVQAGLKPRNISEVHVPGGLSFEATVYVGFLEVPDLGYREQIQFYASEHKQVSHDILLGRSFLKNYITTFNGPEGMFHFHHPFVFPGPLADDDYAT